MNLSNNVEFRPQIIFSSIFVSDRNECATFLNNSEELKCFKECALCKDLKSQYTKMIERHKFELSFFSH